MRRITPLAPVLALLVTWALPAQAATTRYEAENAAITQGVVESNHLGYSGTGFVNYDNVTGSSVSWTVNAAQAGPATLRLRYANGTTANRPMTIAVNGGAPITRDFTGTANWDTWATAEIPVTLNAGQNTVTTVATTANGGPNVDYLEVAVSDTGGDYQAEDATLSQAAVATNHTGFTGSGFVDYVNVAGGYVEWTVQSAGGPATLTFRYANGTTANRPLSVAVNGTAVASRDFAPTANWDTWATAQVPVTLNAGANTVRATATGSAGGPNLDKLTIGAGPPPVTAADAVAPYVYAGWGSAGSASGAMAATGVKWFTLAFILSDGTCNPKWDGSRPLTGGSDQATINAIRAAGGDVVVSVGGWSGNKLGEKCTSASALAGAYQKVISAYALKVLDIDIEDTEWNNATVRQRVIDALKTVKANNPGLKTVITFGTTPTGPDSTGVDMINRGANSGLQNDVWTIMPFDFGGHSGSMGQATVAAMEGLKATVKAAYGYGDATTYAHLGLSSMNGKTDETDEVVSLADFRTMLSYAQQHHLARLTFWELNRDRACGSGGDLNACSGVSQQPYDFTKVFAQYAG
ncbi:MAG: carbohydrate-binding protein [Nonomuraea sp.]|nr:carbohydrate-binding protein [Nonomuraea sp.]